MTAYYPTGDYSLTDGTSTVYVSGPGGLTASVEDNGTVATISTIHTDHLGSTSVVTDGDGTTPPTERDFNTQILHPRRLTKTQKNDTKKLAI